MTISFFLRSVTGISPGSSGGLGGSGFLLRLNKSKIEKPILELNCIGGKVSQ